MRLLLRGWRKLVFRCRRAQLEREIAEEIEFHRSLKEHEHRTSGVPVELARKEMGNLTLAKEESRDLWSFLRFERLLQDMRYAARMFSRTPGFSAIAVLSLAIGIGGNAAMFTLVNTLLIRPLPYREPGRLIRITGIYPRAALAFFEHSRTLDVASASLGSELNLTGDGEAIRVVGSSTTANLFAVLGTPPARGRAFEPGENSPGRDGVVILSDPFWRSKFGGDADVIGRSITLNGVNREVIGIMPASFSYPSSKIQLWIPTHLDPSIMEEYWGGEFVPLIARLRPGASLGQARNEIPSIVAQVRRAFPFPMARKWNADATAILLQQDLTGDVRGRLILLLASVAMVLLIACANVANLLLSRATTRRKEIALRVALGAARARVIRQLLTESILLACAGSALGLLLGMAGLSIFKSLLPAGTPGLAGAGIDCSVVVFVTGLALVTGVGFGIAPALSASQIDLAGAMKTGSRRSTAASWSSLRSWLIAGEVALTLLLLVGAGLLMKSLYRLSEGNPGFVASRILTVRISPNESLCRQRSACLALYDRLVYETRTWQAFPRRPLRIRFRWTAGCPPFPWMWKAIRSRWIFRRQCFGRARSVPAIYG